MNAADFAKLQKVVDYLETATGLIEDGDGDEDDIADARETINEARAVLMRHAPTPAEG